MFYSCCEAETQNWASEFARTLKAPCLIFLHGELGMGKSVIARSIIQQLANDSDLIVPSPTFTLVQSYETTHGTVWHYDLYRLSDADEIWELAWEEAQKGITLVEWPERLGGRFQPDYEITLQLGAETDSRLITCTGGSASPLAGEDSKS